MSKDLSYYQNAIKLNPKCHNCYYEIGNILRNQDKLDRAIEYYQKAIELAPNNPWYYDSLGNVLVQQKNIADAIIAYRKSIALNPDFSWSYYNLGRLLQESSDDMEEAIFCYQKTIELNSESSWSYYFLGEIFAKLKQVSQAISYYLKAIELNPDFYDSHYAVARLFHNNQEFKQAIFHYQQAIRLNSQDFSPYYYLANIFAALESDRQAIDYYLQAIEINHQQSKIHFALGKVLVKQGEAAIDDYRHFFATKINICRAYFEVGLGQAWEQQGALSKAINCYQRAIELEPRFNLPYQLLQYMPLESQQLSQLVDFYQKIIHLVPDFELVWSNLGDILTQQKQVEQAINCYRQSCYYKIISNYPQLANQDLRSRRDPLRGPRSASPSARSQNRKSPDFIIIGEAKCGTSSLFNYLGQHPQILVPHRKEINFFDKNFDYGLDWYLAHFPSITYNQGQDLLTGEATTHYFAYPEVERRMLELFPQIKIIIMLRNPVDRTISEYYHYFNRGQEQRSLTKIIDQAKQNLPQFTKDDLSSSVDRHEYILNSIYVEKIRRWLNSFAAENILIIKSESFFAQTDFVMKTVFDFLDVPNYHISHQIKYNTGYYSRVTNNLRQDLSEIFNSYNCQLEEYLKRDFNW